MRGLHPKEFDVLRRNSGPNNFGNTEQNTDEETAICWALVVRGLLEARETEPGDGWIYTYWDITPLGRIALVCHASILGMVS
jgi:hypothetical protein